MKLIKPCPFCGGIAYVDVLMDKEYIQCQHKKNCIIKPDTWLVSHDMSIRKQINAWNRMAEVNHD